jgi:hypothetical protein
MLEFNSTLLLALLPHLLLLAAFFVDEFLFNPDFIPPQTGNDVTALLARSLVPFFAFAVVGDYIVANVLPYYLSFIITLFLALGFGGTMVFLVVFLGQALTPNLLFALVGGTSSVYLFLATVVYSVVPVARGTVGQGVVLAVGYLIVKSASFYVKFGLLKQAITTTAVIYPSQVLIFTLLVLASLTLAYELVFDKVDTVNAYAHSILTYQEPEGE